MINIIIDKQGRPSKSSIFLGNQHENLDETLQFFFPKKYEDHYRYIAYCYKDRRTGKKITGISPLVEDAFKVTSAITKCAGMWQLYVICKTTQIDEKATIIDLTANNSTGEHIFISDAINGRISGNEIDIEAFENIAVDENIKILYDEILSLKLRVEKNEETRQSQENTRQTAEINRANAENERVIAEQSRSDNEVHRTQSEESRVTAESKRVEVEKARVKSETLRGQSETNRANAENIRAEAEKSRVNVENLRVSAENSRVESETLRKQSEEGRSNEESSRQSAERTRVSEENARKQAETARAQAEQSRVNVESQRVNAETNRANAERQRAEAETNRANAEQSRVDAEALRVTADTERTNKTNAALKTLEDAVASEREKYSQQFFENYFALQRTGKVYTVKFPKWATSQISAGEKLDDNKGLICEPSTRTIKGHDDYESIPLFRTFDVNAYVDDDGIRRVSAIKGDHNYRDVGEVDVFVLGMSYYERHYEDDKYWYYSRTDMPKEGFTIARECINKDGSIQPFGLYGKYVAGLINKKPYSSKGLKPMRYYSGSTSEFGFNSVANSFFDMPQTMAKKGKYYSGGMTCDYKYIATSFWLKFPTLNFQSVMSGCTGYSGQFTASMQYSDNRTYFPLSKSNAESIKVGSYVSVGYKAKSGDSLSNDRAFSTMHAYADDVKVLRKEDIDDSNVAVYLDVETGFNTMPVSVTDTLSSDIMISTMHWHSGYSDDILGRDGAPCDLKEELTNGIYPACIQGIECFVGGYETYANAFMNILDANHREVYITNDATLINTNATTMMNTFKKSKYTMSVTTPSQWNYITKVDLDLENGAFIQSEAGQSGSSSATGYADAVYFDNGTSGQREFLTFGSLYNWSGAGLFYCSGGSGLSLASWSFLARLSLNGVGG